MLLMCFGRIEIRQRFRLTFVATGAQRIVAALLSAVVPTRGAPSVNQVVALEI
jgi:hypothetical protein